MRVTETAHWLEWQDWADPVLQKQYEMIGGKTAVRTHAGNEAVFIPHSQRVQLVKKNIAPLVNSYREFRLWPEQLAETASRSVMLFRGWMMRDLDRAQALTGARVLWSQWDGYLSAGAGATLKADCERRGISVRINSHLRTCQPR